MNPTAILKLKEVFSVLKRNHPKALDYLGKTSARDWSLARSWNSWLPSRARIPEE